MLPKDKSTQIIIAVSTFLAIAALAVFLHYQYGITWKDVKDEVQEAPAWIFTTSLLLLPPLGFPLSIFLFAVGARFGLWVGGALACAAIIGHHFIAFGISNTFTTLSSANDTQKGLWQSLEEKAGGNSSKLLFLWGLLPGLPYIVKLYLPLAMGVKAAPYLWWNSSGHVLGALLFVGFGNAVFGGLSKSVIVVIGIGIAVSVAIKIYRDRLRKSNGAGCPAPDTT